MQRRGVPIFVSIGLLAVINFITGCNAASVAPDAEAGASALEATITPASVLLLPGQSVQFNATLNDTALANPIWLVNSTAGGTASIGEITSSGLYTSPTGMPSAPIYVSATDSAHGTRSTRVPISFFQQYHFEPGTVSASNNPLVALYTVAAPQGATVQIQFGTTTAYGLTTWAQPTPDGGGAVAMLVAGMRASTSYHMQALVHLPNGTTLLDADQVFTTGALPANMLPHLIVQQTPGMTPSSGVELLSLLEQTSQTQLTAVVADLAGNVIWYYPIQPNGTEPLKLLPNGHMLVLNTINAVQEIDLAGHVLSQVSLGDLQQGLAAAGLFFPPLISINHDVVKLRNGHLVMIVSFNETFADQPGISTVEGNAIIDWDPQQGPVWTWSTFDHIPMSHAPYGTSDWTHANALLYSPDDGNLILSMRNQNWIIKINYDNGAGDGSILWRLGPDGDFTLPSGQAPVEWNYGQHYPVLLGPNTSGIFPLMFFNNGINRLVDTNNDVCGTPGLTPCYSSVPIFQLNEYTKTAQVLSETNLSPAYSFCCGSTNLLANGDLEFDVADDENSTFSGSYIQEMTQEQLPQLVWQMNIGGQLAYRGFRIPSLYPGVEWTQSAIAAANVDVKAQPPRKAAER